MLHSLIRPTLLVAVVASVAACHSSGAGTAPAPARATTQAATPAGPAMSATASAATIQLGDSLFNNGGCKNCHGVGGKGAQNGPALAAGKWTHISGSFDDVVKIITTGVPAAEIKDPSHRFRMRARGGPMNLTDDQIRAIAAYVLSLSKH
jgi:mono/diheme cytochrome c family protein